MPILMVLMPSIAAVLLTLIASSWHLSTRIDLELLTRRLAFTPGSREPREVLEASVAFSSLVIERCDAVTFLPEQLEVADPRSTSPEVAGDELAWRPLAPAGPLRLSCNSPDAKVTLRSPGATPDVIGTLDRIWVSRGSEVILNAYRGREIEVTLEVDGPQSLAIALGDEVEIKSEFVEPGGVPALPSAGDLLIWRARLASPDHLLDLESQRGLTLVLGIPSAVSAAGIFAADPIPVTSLELVEERLDGEPGTPLLEGRLSYPERPGMPAVILSSSDYLSVGELTASHLESLGIDAGTGALRLHFDGIAGTVRSTDGAFVQDHRLTLWERFRHGSLWTRLGAALAWGLATGLAGYKDREVWKQALRSGRA